MEREIIVKIVDAGAGECSKECPLLNGDPAECRLFSDGGYKRAFACIEAEEFFAGMKKEMQRTVRLLDMSSRGIRRIK